MDSPKIIPEVSFLRFLNHANNILQNPLPFHAANFKNLGDLFRLKIGLRSSVLFCRDAGLLQHALQKNQKNYTKSYIQTRDVAKYVGKGLLTAEGEDWQKQRKLIQPTFHKSQLALLLGTVHQTILEELQNITTGKPIDIFPIFNDLAFQTVVKSIFNISISEQDINDLQHTTEATQRMLVQELRQPFLVWWFQLSGKTQKHLDLTQHSRNILKRLVDERKQSNEHHDDLLDMLLQARYEDGSAMTEQQLIDEILILFAAGHETTSNALTFTCELLARHPEAQHKILEEVRRIKNEADDLMQWVKQASYTKLVIEESMRLYPPAYFIDRVNKEEDQFNGWVLPKGSNLLFSVYEIHRHPDFWKDPESFIPERFLDDSIKFSKHYYPFGAGPRMCIGNNFAMYEMILTIMALVEQFEIVQKKDPIQIKPLITLKPFGAVLELKSRL